MRTVISALGIVLGSILYAVIWARIFYFSFNYRESDESGYVFILFPFIFIVSFLLGIDIHSAIFRFFSKPERGIAPSVLLYGFVISFAASICIIAVFGIDKFGIDFWSLGIILLFQIVGLTTAFHFQTNKTVKQFGKQISIALLINVIFLMVVCINDFPGVNAPIEARQNWAYKEFSGYSKIVNSIERTSEITDKVGQIRFAAPTKGRNLFFRVGAGNMPLSNLTLEVVGEKRTGIAYITALGNQGVWGICFEERGKKTQLWGWESCN